MRGYFFTLLRLTSFALVMLLVGNIGFDVIWSAVKDIFSSWGGFLVFVVAMAGLSGVVVARSKKPKS
ncbi:hypothetical protein GCM10010402_60620 [Actinomadura luteofluorescens]|uniref:hypothetical protein n=1 Tax=Actinomadura luteofluorescens TaxID=46163 RepID=UPI002164661E|nr:hypothetical protein [Actinomadura glauciflava]MCR3743478.1 hypothetical protein [Actinomadura glauciflava]